MNPSELTPHNIAALASALKPFRDYVSVNDNDTLARLDPDSLVLSTACGSWSGPTPITLGDFRRLIALTSALGLTKPVR